MRKQEKEFYKNAPTIGVMGLTNTLALELKEIEYGIEDHVIIKCGETIHRLQVYYSDNTYFNLYGLRYHLSDFIRTNLFN